MRTHCIVQGVCAGVCAGVCVLVCVLVCVCWCVCAQSCLILCDPLDCSPPGSSVHGIFLVRILEKLPFPTPGDLPDPGIEPVSHASPALAGGFFTTSTVWKAIMSLLVFHFKYSSLYMLIPNSPGPN